jgi:hypothetical protein
VHSIWSTSSTAHDGDDDWTMASAFGMWQSAWRLLHLGLDTRLPRREDRHARPTLHCDHPTRAGARGPGLDLAKPARNAMDENWDSWTRYHACSRSFHPTRSVVLVYSARGGGYSHRYVCRGPPARKDRDQALTCRGRERDCSPPHASRSTLHDLHSTSTTSRPRFWFYCPALLLQIFRRPLDVRLDVYYVLGRTAMYTYSGKSCTMTRKDPSTSLGSVHIALLSR